MFISIKSIIFFCLSFLKIGFYPSLDEIGMEEVELVCPSGTKQVSSYEDHSFLELRCEREDGVWNGKRKLFYLSGKLYTDSEFCNGKLCGKWITYYESGTMKSLGTYKKGKPNGVWSNYYENGNEFSKGKFKNGCKTKIWFFYYQNGNKHVKVLANVDNCTTKVLETYKKKE